MSISTMTGPLAGAVLFLLSSGATAQSSSLFVAIASFAGETKVDCNKVCAGGGLQFMTGSSYSLAASAVEYTCSCTLGEIRVECTTAGFGQAFTQCAPAGTGWGLEKLPSESEVTGEKDLKEHPNTKKKLERRAGKAEVDAPGSGNAVHCEPCPDTSDQLISDEIAEALSLHNKFREMVGVPPLWWNCELMCQAQKHASMCVFEHSDSYNSPIPAGENLASGSDIELAAWMWFSEYGIAPAGQHAESGGNEHFTAMVWKATKELGCGKCRIGQGSVVCQYANSPPNSATSSTSYKENVPVFDGIKDDFESWGFDVEVVKQMLTQFKSWSLPVGDALERLYTASADGSIERTSQHGASAAITGGIIGGVLAVAVAAAVSAFKRGGRVCKRSQISTMDLEDAGSSLVTE